MASLEVQQNKNSQEKHVRITLGCIIQIGQICTQYGRFDGANGPGNRRSYSDKTDAPVLGTEVGLVEVDCDSDPPPVAGLIYGHDTAMPDGGSECLRLSWVAALPLKAILTGSDDFLKRRDFHTLCTQPDISCQGIFIVQDIECEPADQTTPPSAVILEAIDRLQHSQVIRSSSAAQIILISKELYRYDKTARLNLIPQQKRPSEPCQLESRGCNEGCNEGGHPFIRVRNNINRLINEFSGGDRDSTAGQPGRKGAAPQSIQMGYKSESSSLNELDDCQEHLFEDLADLLMDGIRSIDNRYSSTERFNLPPILSLDGSESRLQSYIRRYDCESQRICPISSIEKDLASQMVVNSLFQNPVSSNISGTTIHGGLQVRLYKPEELRNRALVRTISRSFATSEIAKYHEELLQHKLSLHESSPTRVPPTRVSPTRVSPTPHYGNAIDVPPAVLRQLKHFALTIEDRIRGQLTAETGRLMVAIVSKLLKVLKLTFIREFKTTHPTNQHSQQ